jgi:hypothetical protein
MPKCPACVAGYVALATGIGVSLNTASWVRTLLVAACVASIGLLTLRITLRGLPQRRIERSTRRPESSLENA